MLIGDLVAKTGLSKDTIRFYEKAGLISLSATQRRANNYKEYPASVVRALEVVQQLKKLGFSLKEIAEMTREAQAGLFSCEQHLPKVKEKIKQIDLEIENLLRSKQSLGECIAACPDDCQLHHLLINLKN